MAICKKFNIEENLEAVKVWTTEIKALNKLKSHPNIVSLINHYFEPHTKTLAIITEHPSDNLLSDEIMRRITSKTQFSEAEICSVLAQASHALAFAHRHNIFHLNLSPKAIIFNKEDKKIKICDFTAPEMSFPSYSELKNEVKKDDIWAIGAIGYDMMTLQPLGESMPKTEESEYRKELTTFIMWLLEENSSMRPNFTEIMEIPEI